MIKIVIGMLIKIGCGCVIWILFIKYGINFEKYVLMFLNLMEKYILDCNDEVSQGYVCVIVYLFCVVFDVVKQCFIEKFINFYLELDIDVCR